MEALLAPLVAGLVAVMSAGGLAGVAILMGLESACLPLPSEIIMPFAGYVASQGQYSLLAAALAGRSAAISARIWPMRWARAAGGPSWSG